MGYITDSFTTYGFNNLIFYIMKNLFFLVLGCMVLQGCFSRREDILIETKHATQIIKGTKLDSLSVPIDSVSNNYYSGISNVYETSSDVYYVSYNKATHSLDWLSLTNEQNSFHTIFDSQGPNMVVMDVEGLYIHNFDSIFINDGFSLLIVDKKGAVKKKMKNLFNQDSDKSFRLYNYDSSNLFYNKKRKSIISHIFFIQNNLTANTPSMAEIFIGNGDFRFLQSFYPQYYINQYKYLGSDICINTSYTLESVTYNFSCESNIYTYNLITDEINCYGGKSKLSKNRIAKMKSTNREKKWIHYIENPRFFKVVFDPFRNLYIRLHWKEINYRKSQNRFNTPYEKEIIMSVYTKQFELINEFVLQSDTYLINTEEITSKGLIINSNHPKNRTYEPEKYKVHTYLIEL